MFSENFISSIDTSNYMDIENILENDSVAVGKAKEIHKEANRINTHDDKVFLVCSKVSLVFYLVLIAVLLYDLYSSEDDLLFLIATSFGCLILCGIASVCLLGVLYAIFTKDGITINELDRSYINNCLIDRKTKCGVGDLINRNGEYYGVFGDDIVDIRGEKLDNISEFSVVVKYQYYRLDAKGNVKIEYDLEVK